MKCTPIAENVKRMMKEKGLKRQYIVNASNDMNERQVSDLLCGRRKMDEHSIVTLAKALGVDFNTLFGYSKD